MSRCKECKENTAWDVLKCTVDEDGKHHSVSGRPSMVYTNINQVHCKTWHKHGRYHREDGPAHIATSKVSEYKQYFVEGKRVDPKDLKERINK